MEGLTYKASGVDIDEADRLIGSISSIAKETYRPEVLTGIGSFGALFGLDLKRYKNPVLVSGTDGVGTKLKIAFLADRHDTIGIDLVAMCVNDIITSGAEPLFFLDYFATSGLRVEKGAEIIKGIAKGCLISGCSLIGGETAEMPGFYREGEYDLAGFVVGVVEREGIIDGSGIQPGDAVIGIPSSGLHSNGYSLARKTLLEAAKLDIDAIIPPSTMPLVDELLNPTRIYVKTILELSNSIRIKGMAHITGGGITENLPRTLPKGLCARIDVNSWNIPAIFRLIQEKGNIADTELRRTFNCGIGYIVIVAKEECDMAIKILGDAISLGRVEEGTGVIYTG